MARGLAQKVIHGPAAEVSSVSGSMACRPRSKYPAHVAAHFGDLLGEPERTRASRPPGIGVYCAGTLVAEDFRVLSALGLDRAPWTDRRLIGMVDFPGFRVTPGSRRSIVVDEAAAAFARALEKVEPQIAEVLQQLQRQRAEEADRKSGAGTCSARFATSIGSARATLYCRCRLKAMRAAGEQRTMGAGRVPASPST